MRVILLVFAIGCGSPSTPAPTPAPAPAPPVTAVAPPVDAAEPADAPALASEPDAAPPSVACQSDDDCWLDGTKPIARPRALRGKRLRPCKDSERVPICKAGACAVEGYKC
jgi:hypothetical protein